MLTLRRALFLCFCIFHGLNYVMSKVPEYKPHSIRSCKHEMRIIPHKTYLYFTLALIDSNWINRKQIVFVVRTSLFFYIHLMRMNRVTETKYLIFCDPSDVVVVCRRAIRTKQNITKLQKHKWVSECVLNRSKTQNIWLIQVYVLWC